MRRVGRVRAPPDRAIEAGSIVHRDGAGLPDERTIRDRYVKSPRSIGSRGRWVAVEGRYSKCRRTRRAFGSVALKRLGKKYRVWRRYSQRASGAS